MVTGFSRDFFKRKRISIGTRRKRKSIKLTSKQRREIVKNLSDSGYELTAKGRKILYKR